MSLTREEFREEVQQIIEDLQQGEGDLILTELRGIIEDTRDHDPQLSAYLQDISNSVSRAIDYLKTKG